MTLPHVARRYARVPVEDATAAVCEAVARGPVTTRALRRLVGDPGAVAVAIVNQLAAGRVRYDRHRRRWTTRRDA